MPLNSLLINDVGFCQAEVENTYGTDPDNDPKTLVLREAPDVSELREQIERNRMKPSTGGDEHAVQDQAVEASFQTVVSKLPASDGAVPTLRPVLMASGHDETLTANSGSPPFEAIYSPIPRNYDSATFTFYIADKNSTNGYTKIVVSGARCIPTFQYSMGSEPVVEVEIKGLYATWEPITDLSSEEPSTLAQGMEAFTSPNQQFQFGAANTDVTNLEFSPSRGFNDVESATAESSLKEALLRPGDDRHSGSFDPLATSVGSTDDPLDVVRNAKTHTLALDITDGAGAEFHINAPAAQLTEAAMSAGDKHYRYDSSYALNETSYAENDDYELRWVRS